MIHWMWTPCGSPKSRRPHVTARTRKRRCSQRSRRDGSACPSPHLPPPSPVQPVLFLASYGASLAVRNPPLRVVMPLPPTFGGRRLPLLLCRALHGRRPPPAAAAASAAATSAIADTTAAASAAAASAAAAPAAATAGTPPRRQRRRPSPPPDDGLTLSDFVSLPPPPATNGAAGGGGAPRPWAGRPRNVGLTAPAAAAATVAADAAAVAAAGTAAAATGTPSALAAAAPATASAPPPASGGAPRGLPADPSRRSVYLETAGCQMNVADTEVVRALLLDAGYTVVPDPASAAVVVLNTCAIRDNAERRVWARLQALRAADRKRRVPPRRRRPGLPPLPDAPGGGHPLAAVPPAADPMVVTAAGGPPAGGECAEGVGTAAAPGSADGPSAAFVPPARRGRPPKQLIALLGCMAERLKASLLTGPGRLVDVVVGPDAYRDLPRLLAAVADAADPTAAAYNVQLSADETYADVAPVRDGGGGGASAYVSIMRGCDSACAYCVVPMTRGRERSRPADTVVAEVARLAAEGVREVTLLGQNVNAYRDLSSSLPLAATGAASAVQDDVGGGGGDGVRPLAAGFRAVVPAPGGGIGFAALLAAVCDAAPHTRIRYTSPHPKDYTPDVVDLHGRGGPLNLCRAVHVPVQSGSDAVLARMRRGYAVAAYMELVDGLRAAAGGEGHLALSTDLIAGFCGETPADHEATLRLVATVGYDAAFMFAYSERARTSAATRLADDVPTGVKAARLREVIDTFHATAAARAAALVGTRQLVLVDGPGRRGSGRVPGVAPAEPGPSAAFGDGGDGGGEGRFGVVARMATDGRSLRPTQFSPATTAETAAVAASGPTRAPGRPPLGTGWRWRWWRPTL